MTHRPQHNPASPEAIALGYQPDSTGARWLLVFLIAFTVAMLALAWFVWYIMQAMETHNGRVDLPRSALHLEQQPPPPNLQPTVGHDNTDAEDLAALRAREDAMFAKLGWTVDAKTHEVRIPADIEQRVAEDARARASGAFVPPTTTGKTSNSTVPGPVPPYDTQPGINGGRRP